MLPAISWTYQRTWEGIGNLVRVATVQRCQYVRRQSEHRVVWKRVLEPWYAYWLWLVGIVNMFLSTDWCPCSYWAKRYRVLISCLVARTPAVWERESEGLKTLACVTAPGRRVEGLRLRCRRTTEARQCREQKVWFGETMWCGLANKCCRSGSVCCTFAMSWKSMTGVVSWVSALASMRDSASATLLSTPRTYRRSVVNWEMKSRCRHWRGEWRFELALKENVNGRMLTVYD